MVRPAKANETVCEANEQGQSVGVDHVRVCQPSDPGDPGFPGVRTFLPREEYRRIERVKVRGFLEQSGGGRVACPET